MPGRVRRRLFVLLWGEGVSGSASALSRTAGLSFSATYRELEAMRAARLVFSERVGTSVVYRANSKHPHSELLRQLAALNSAEKVRPKRDEDVLAWFAGVGAPVGAPTTDGADTSTPPVEEVLAEALATSHNDPTMARVLPGVLWRHRRTLQFDRLVSEATRRNERQTLGCFLELAGTLGRDRKLVRVAQRLRDCRRSRPRMFFSRHHGRHELALAQRNTPSQVRDWHFVMNMTLEGFREAFDKVNAL